MKLFNLNVTDEFHAELTQAASLLNKPASAFVREAIREKLDREVLGADLTPYDFEWHMRFNPDVLARPLDQRINWAMAHQRNYERDNPRQPEPKKEAA